MIRFHLGEALDGPYGTAVPVLVDEHDRPDTYGTVAAWYLTCPGQSPAWDRYLLAVIHLRPIDGAIPAVLAFPGATHEVLVAALDPVWQAPDPNRWRLLRPLNVVEQVVLPDDAAAAELADACARAIIAGVLPAEPALAGQVEPWRTSLVKTSAHLRGEAHAE